ncbi:hypothetical protein CHS0354_031651 [Potamilus streckersoni]|uniref:Sodium-dependent glucose transporter 1 n=1 Tax=Potamilus streckersoni TaxID=2493646 RepID=A0AAE0SQR6_9BIVA|nr:hypothetical protein CHS0354_031651 [Potamilus streckersoni]
MADGCFKDGNQMHGPSHSELVDDQERISFLGTVHGGSGKTEDKPIKVATQMTMDRGGVFTMVKADPVYRFKFFVSVCLCIAYIGMGLCAGHTGPAFPDFLLIVNKDLATSSWLLTVGAFGYLTGTLIFGVLYDRFNRLLLLFLSILGASIGSGTTPWCSNFPLMIAVRIISGVFFGGIDTGGNTEVISIWGAEGRPYIQMMHFSFAIGAIISPLFTEPFLAPKITVFDTINSSFNGTCNISHTSALDISVLSSNSDFTNNSIQFTQRQYWGETNVQYAYLITMIIGILSAIPFLVLYLRIRAELCTDEEHKAKTSPRISVQLTICRKIVILMLLMSVFHLYSAIEDTFSSYLMTFTLLHLNWTKLNGSLVTSMFWASFGFGRFLGIFIVRVVSPTKVLLIYCSLLFISLAGFLVGSLLLFDPMVWMFASTTGLSMSVIFPAIFTWTEENVMPVSGKIASLLLVAASSGSMLNPLYLGYLMENKSPLWFTYLLLGQSLSCLLLYVIVVICTKVCIWFQSDADLDRSSQTNKEELVNVNPDHA